MQASQATTIFSFHELTIAWTMRTIRARYKQSILGGLWAVIQPAATAIIFSIIFTRFVPIDTGEVPYILFSFAAMVPWTLFTTSISDMVESLVINMNLVSKIYFPREVLPFAALMARLLDFIIASLILIALIIFYGIPFLTPYLLYLPAIVMIQLALALGIGFAGSALNVFYRDIKHLIVLSMQIWMYASPIIYPVSSVPEQFRPLYFLNPMASIIESYRAVLLYQQPPNPYLILSAIIAVIVLGAGYWFFKKVEFQFADVV